MTATLSAVVARRTLMAALWKREDAELLANIPESAFPSDLRPLWRVAIEHDAKGLGRFHLRIRPNLKDELARLADELFHERGDELAVMTHAELYGLRDTLSLDSFPALKRWREQVIASRRRCSPLETAAAWELTALECEQLGELEGAATAREHAKSALVKKQETAA